MAISSLDLEGDTRRTSYACAAFARGSTTENRGCPLVGVRSWLRIATARHRQSIENALQLRHAGSVVCRLRIDSSEAAPGRELPHHRARSPHLDQALAHRAAE